MQPGIEIGPPRDWAAVDAALARLDRYDWLVFSSGNGVRWFLDRLLAGGGDLRRLGGVKLAAIGPGTAAELAKYHLKADLMPAEYRAESLAESLLAASPRGRFLLARADRGRQVLPERLSAAGATVDQVVAYSTTEIAAADPEIVAALGGRPHRMGDGDQFGDCPIDGRAVRRRPRSGPLGEHQPDHLRVLGELGYTAAAEANEYTMAGVVAAIFAAERAGG